MVNNDFSRFLENVCTDAFKSSLTDSEQVWDVSSISDFTEIKTCEHITMLTVSSHQFRSIATLHFTHSKSSNKFVSRKLNLVNSTDLSRDQLDDFLGEVMNSLVGSMKRKLQEQVVNLGMSTPCVLSERSLNYVDSLNIDHKLFLRASSEGEAMFFAGLFTSIYEEIEIGHILQNSDEVCGDLELF